MRLLGALIIYIIAITSIGTAKTGAIKRIGKFVKLYQAIEQHVETTKYLAVKERETETGKGIRAKKGNRTKKFNGTGKGKGKINSKGKRKGKGKGKGTGKRTETKHPAKFYHTIEQHLETTNLLNPDCHFHLVLDQNLVSPILHNPFSVEILNFGFTSYRTNTALHYVYSYYRHNGEKQFKLLRTRGLNCIVTVICHFSTRLVEKKMLGVNLAMHIFTANNFFLTDGSHLLRRVIHQNHGVLIFVHNQILPFVKPTMWEVFKYSHLLLSQHIASYDPPVYIAAFGNNSFPIRLQIFEIRKESQIYSETDLQCFLKPRFL